MLPFTFRCCSTIKLCFLSNFFERPLCCLAYHFNIFVQFSRCNFCPLLSPEISSQFLKSLFPSLIHSDLVGPSGLEPPTLRLSVVRSSQLSYGPASSQTSYRSLPSPKAYSLRCSSFSSQTHFVGLCLDPETGYVIHFGGDSRDRTGDLLLARQALSQLSYIPNYFEGEYPLN